MPDPADVDRSPGHGAYARPERERRFLVGDDVPRGGATRLLEDRYLDGLRLRLRRVTQGNLRVHKLTQKVRPDPGNPAEVQITNMYLSEDEYLCLLQLPGAALVKERRVVTTATHSFVVDEFRGTLSGLRLAEVEVEDLSEQLDLPSWLGQEVTYDDRYSGGRLARAASRPTLDP